MIPILEKMRLIQIVRKFGYTEKGVNVLEQRSQVHFMAEFQELLDFPPARKLGTDGKLNPKKATQ